TPSQAGCVSATALRDMRMRLHANPANTLKDFYRLIGAVLPAGTPNPEHLRKGLDELRDGDIAGILASLDVPGLALAGGKDPLVPLAASEELGGFARYGG